MKIDGSCHCGNMPTLRKSILKTLGYAIARIAKPYRVLLARVFAQTRKHFTWRADNRKSM